MVNTNRCKDCGSYVSLKHKHTCKPNSMQDKKHSEKTKKKIGAKSVNRNWATGKRSRSWKSGETIVKASKDIRGLTEYVKWREEVIRNGGVNSMKGMQTHHMKPVSAILRDNNVKTIEEARNCKELWDVSNGVVLRKGEHFIISQMERTKRHSKGFYELLKHWIKTHEDKAIDLD